MKKAIQFILPVLFVIMSTVLAFAGDGDPEMADTMRSNGKIYVVVTIVVIILVGLIAYLFLLDNKVKKLEKLVERQKTAR